MPTQSVLPPNAPSAQPAVPQPPASQPNAPGALPSAAKPLLLAALANAVIAALFIGLEAGTMLASTLWASIGLLHLPASLFPPGMALAATAAIAAGFWQFRRAYAAEVEVFATAPDPRLDSADVPLQF